MLDIHYLHPGKLAEYLVEHHPVALFGTHDDQKAQQSLFAFWEGYRNYHGDHEVFKLGVPECQLIPIVLHGDEGRGKRRSSTTLVSWESPIGIKGHSSSCGFCKPTMSWSGASCSPELEQNSFVHLLRSNMKSYSFIQHFPVFVLPGTLWKVYKTLTIEMLSFLAGELKSLFQDGFEAKGRTYRLVVVGSKGDLKWVSKIALLTRGYEN